jgi:lipoprotein-anchoring transpeptidase ErfK/SrfK
VHVNLDSPHRRARRRRAKVVAALLLPLVALAACGSDEPDVEAAPDTTTAAAPAVGCSPELADSPYRVAFAERPGEVAVYANPNDPLPSQSFSVPRQTDSDPPIEVPRAFLVTAEPEADDCGWINVLLPTRPNGSTGWVKRDDVRVAGQEFRIEVYLNEFNLKAYKDQELILDAPIGVAQENRPTPGGLYYTTELLKSSDPAYGPWAFGLSGFSEVLTSFNGGQGQLGLHGTNQPERIGTRVSSGCIRLENANIEKLVAEVGESSEQRYGIPVQVFA